MRLNFTLPGFAPDIPPPPPPPAPPEPPKQVDARRELTQRGTRKQQRAAAVRNKAGARGQSVAGSVQTALKALTGQ